MRAFAFFAVILLTTSFAFAQNVFHPASEVAAGTFGSSVGGGNYTFNNSLVIADNLGIGTTNPSAVFHASVSSPTGNNNFYYDVYSNSYFPIFGARRARGTSDAPSAVLANDALAGYGARGYGATGFATSTKGALIIVAAENWNDTAQGTFLRFSTTANGTTTFSEKVRISDVGNVGIGTTTPSQKLTVAGDANITGNLIVGGNISGGSPVNIVGGINVLFGDINTTGNFYGSINASFVQNAPWSAPNVSIFTASGTWTKSAGAKFCKVVCIGGGGGGGGGIGGTGYRGGAGGGGGAYAEKIFTASDLGATENITVGVGGTSGTGDGVGGAGGPGGNSTFGTIPRLMAYRGGGGTGGTNTADTSGGAGGGLGSAGGNGAAGSNSTGGNPQDTAAKIGIGGGGAGGVVNSDGLCAENGGAAGGGGGTSTGKKGGSSLRGGGGGGAGGQGYVAGGNGGASNSFIAGGGGNGGAAETAGTAGSDGTSAVSGAGGGGGGGSSINNGRAGGAGGAGGGGGGGGGTAPNGVSGGAGGAGGRGEVRVYCW